MVVFPGAGERHAQPAPQANFERVEVGCFDEEWVELKALEITAHSNLLATGGCQEWWVGGVGAWEVTAMVRD